MSRIPLRPAPDTATFHGHVGRGRWWLAVLLPALMLASVAVARATILDATGQPGAAPLAISPGAAAAAFRAALKPAAGGISFTVVQRASINARPGGPLIDVPDPADPYTIIGQTDSYPQASYIERGGVSADGFWMELRDGPVGDAKPDFAAATYAFGTIVKGGKTYRNDGDGWYQTSQPPGIGIDPATAALVPTLLGRIGTTTPRPATIVDGLTVRSFAADAKVADIPGLIAVDGASFTELRGPLEYGFDDAGRLVRIHAVARNTNVDTWDLLLDVVITFGYGDAGAIPDPSPIVVPSDGITG